MVGSCVEWAKFCKDEGWESVGSKAKFTTTLSLLFLDAGRLAQGGCARCSGGLTHGVLLAFSGGALALLRGKQDGPATGIAGNRGARRSSTGCVTDQAARAGATGSLDFRRTRSSKDRAGALLSRRIQLPRDSRHRRAQTEHAIAMLIAGTATVAGVVGRQALRSSQGMRTLRLLRRRRALLNCAPISHDHLADRSMRAAVS